MSKEISFPPLLDLPPGELEARKQHLLSEISREPDKARRSLLSFKVPRLRIVALAGVVAAVAAASATLSIVLGGGPAAEAAPLLVQTTHGPNWSGKSTGSATRTALANSSVTPATTEISGGTVSEQALLHTIIDGMQPTAIEKIEISDSVNDVALHMTGADASPRTFWEESLVAAAFRDRSTAAGDNLTISLFAGDDSGASLPPGPATPLSAAAQGAGAAAKQSFEDAAAKTGISLADLMIYQPDGIAVAATITSDDPASSLLHQMPAFLAALGDRWSDFDGTYISLVDGTGQTVWETSTNGRISEGSVGSSPDLAGCSPVVNYGPTTTPACPAK